MTVSQVLCVVPGTAYLFSAWVGYIDYGFTYYAPTVSVYFDNSLYIGPVSVCGTDEDNFGVDGCIGDEASHYFNVGGFVTSASSTPTLEFVFTFGAPSGQESIGGLLDDVTLTLLN